jgi:hypothetical protein
VPPQAGINSGVVAIDSQGNCYLGGNGTITTTTGAFQPSPNAASSQFIEKFDTSGNVLFATYLSGSASDSASAIAVDGSGNVYATGTTVSDDFPTKNAYQSLLHSAQDVFISVLNSTGTALIYSTYWGGSENDNGAAIAADRSGNAYITGVTNSADFPVINAIQPTFAGTPGSANNAFVIKLNPTGQPVYSTYFGGTAADLFSQGFVIAADANGYGYVAGTAEGGIPMVNPIQATTASESAFVSKFAPDGSALIYSSYLGELTTPVGIAVDSVGQVYLGGNLFTNSAPPFGSVPLVSPIQNSSGTFNTGSGNSDAFASVINATGSAVVFSTDLGADQVAWQGQMGFGIDGSGNLYLSGGATFGFPITDPTDGVYSPVPGCCVHGFPDPLFPQPFLLKISLTPGPSFGHPSEVDFTPAPSPVGTSTQAVPVLIANTSATVDISISNIAIGGDFSQTNDCPGSLVAATKCDLMVAFTPTAGGQRTGSITITDSAPGSPHVIDLIGIGLVAMDQVSPTSLTFGSQAVGTTSAAQQVTVTVTGLGAVTISGVQTSGDFSETNNCSSALPCQILVTFTPTVTGNRTGILTIVDNTTASPHTIALSGTGGVQSLGLGVAPGGSSTAMVAAGNPASYMLTVGGGGISGTANLTCTGAPAGATCSVPASQTVGAATQASFTAKITTTARSTGALRSKSGNPLWFLATTIMAGLIIFPKVAKIRVSKFSIIASIALIALTCSCGGSSGNTTSGGTPAGSYSLMVTATMGATQQSTPLTLIVQ